MPSQWVLMIPSGVTLAALCFGVTAIRFANEGNFRLSVLLLLASSICDAADGHVARYLNAVTQFGGELDSLCDLVDFGAAPALLMYLWITKFTSPTHISDDLVWACSCIFVAAGAYRLARFNVGTFQHPRPLPTKTYPAERPDGGDFEVKKVELQRRYYLARSKFFQGIPTPVAAILVCFPVILHENNYPQFELSQYIPLTFLDSRVTCCLLQLLLAALMVSHVPSLSGKVFMKDTSRESHLRNRSVGTMVLKWAALGVVLGLVFKDWMLVMLYVEFGFVFIVLFSPLIFRYVAVDA
eukprot:c6203_g1_i1.p1 GENE.c6203_g1_i1~~c6203_g1_i1.p1  ORF type:complete len:309 (+),score=48.66 c6203_g1_i1:39-929(+)